MLQPAALAFRAQSPLPPRVRGRSAAGRRFLLRGRGHMSFQRHRKIYPDVETLLALGWLPSQRLIGMSFQLTIPRRVALQHCSLPLRQPRSFLNKIVPFVDIISASGYLSPFSLYQLRGPLQNEREAILDAKVDSSDHAGVGSECHSRVEFSHFA